MVAGMWWFFTLIMISSYTANLAGKIKTKPNIDFNFKTTKLNYYCLG